MLRRRSILLDVRRGEDLVRSFRLTPGDDEDAEPIDLTGATVTLRIDIGPQIIEAAGVLEAGETDRVTISIPAATFAAIETGALPLQLWARWSDGTDDHLADGFLQLEEGFST